MEHEMSRRFRFPGWVALGALCLLPGMRPALAQANPNGFITSGNWLVLGPFSHTFGCTYDDGQLLTAHLAPSSIHSMTPAAGETVDYDPLLASTGGYHGPLADGKPVWRPLDDGSDDDDLDLEVDAIRLGAPAANIMTFAATYFRYDGKEPVEVVLCAGSDDAVQVWLDTEPIHNYNACRPRAPCQEQIPVTISPGSHRLVLAVWDAGGGFGGSLGFRTLAGDPITDLDPEWLFQGTNRDGFSLPEEGVFIREVSTPGDRESCPPRAGGPLTVTIRADLPPGPDIALVRDRAAGDFAPARVTAGQDGAVGELPGVPFVPAPLGMFADHRTILRNPPCPTGNGAAYFDDGSTPGNPADDSYSIDSIGEDIWAQGDSLTFAYKRVEGDFVFTAHIAGRIFVPGTRWGKFGVMTRQDLSPRSRYAATKDHGEDLQDQTRFGARPTHGGSDNFETTALGAGEHHDWLRIERAGDTFIGSSSADGIDYVEQGRLVWRAAPAAVLVGLFASSHSTSCLDDPMRITFDEVELQGGTGVPLLIGPTGAEVVWTNVPRAALAAGLTYVIDIDAGPVSFEGEAGTAPVLGEATEILRPPVEEYGPLLDAGLPHVHDVGMSCPGTGVENPADGRIVLTGAGQDIWIQGDQFTFAYREVAGDFSARVHLADRRWAAGTRWGRAGIMAREDCGARSRYSLISDTGADPLEGNRFEGRFTHGAADNFEYYDHPFIGQRSNTIRLDRCGDTFIGYVLSEDDPQFPGQGTFGGVAGDWIEFGRHEWVADPPASVRLGLVVNSTLRACDLSTITFEDWQVAPACGGGVLDLACAPDGDGGAVVAWRNPDGADPAAPIEVRVNGEPFLSLPGSAASAGIPVDDLAPGGVSTISVVNASRIPASCNYPPGFSREGFITDWLLLGPFAQTGSYNPGVETIRRDYLTDGAGVNELEIEPRAGDTVATAFGGAAASVALAASPERPDLNPGGIPTWRERRGIEDTIYFDWFPSSHYGSDLDNLMTYAVAYLELDVDMTVDIGLASNDSIQVLLDGEEVHINDTIRYEGRPGTVQDVVSSAFQPGLNKLARGPHRLMVKVFEGYGNTAFRLRFQDEFGNPVVEGITVRLEPPQLPQPVFHRGDADGDGEINITDGVFTLNFLFLGGRAPVCREAANANDDADLNITDGVYLLNFLFLGGPAPPAPGPATFPCGPDPEGSPSDLGCVEYGGC